MFQEEGNSCNCRKQLAVSLDLMPYFYEITNKIYWLKWNFIQFRNAPPRERKRKMQKYNYHIMHAWLC